jgi:aldehyde dehydrogenase (NAD(P)+)
VTVELDRSPIDRAAIDRAIAELAEGEQVWARTGLSERRRLLAQVRQATDRHARDWVRAACTYKQLPETSQLAGEEWISGPYAVLTGARALMDTIAALEAGRSPVDGYPITTAPGGRLAVKVLPHTVYDRLLLRGFSAEVWTAPGADEATLRRDAGLALKHPEQTNGIGVVLGAGNVTSIPVLDVFYELYANNRVVALKLNPITDVMLEPLSDALRPLIDLGVLRILTGAADACGYLIHHRDVTHVHLTGSAATHDKIVQGPPRLDKPVTSELGGVSPVIVLPGDWSAADLRFQAEHVATQRLHNNGYNCIATQVVVLSQDWPQKDAFLACLRDVLASAPARPAYYPGSDARVASARAAYPDAETIAGRLLIERVSPGTPALTTEFFAPVLAVTELPGTGFLDAAVALANEQFAGTLGVNLIAHPRTIAALGPRLDEAIAALRYGTVAVNAWTGMGFLTAAATWGAYPGHTLAEVGSGIGVVHNSLLLDNSERTVVRGPFRPFPKPPWFVTNKTAASTGQRLTAFAAQPGWKALPPVFVSALRG